MGAIIAVVGKASGSATKKAVDMLKTLIHKNIESFGIASTTKVRIENSLDLLQNVDMNSPILIGHLFSRISKSDKPQPIILKNATMVFEGRTYPSGKKISVLEFAAEKLEHNREENAGTFIRNIDGSFAFALAESDRLIVGRDSLGIYPLYYGKSEDLVALASERKALWKIGIEKVYSFPPGHLAIVNRYDLKFKAVQTLVRPEKEPKSMQGAAKKLQRLLQNSVGERVSDLEEVAVAFSGGLDSSIIAVLAKEHGIDVHLFFVSLKNQSETKHAERVAEWLNLPLRIHSYNEKDVEDVLPKVLWLIEVADPVQVGIGIPMFWAAEEASKEGFKVMLAGQGADELFGGYRRYLNNYSRHGEEFARSKIANDVIIMHETNYERDSKICNFHGVELRLPFGTHKLTRLALALPLKLKIASPNDMLRKVVLRKMAKNIGLPDFIANKPKRAIQYSTGAAKAIRRIAKQKGFETREYVQREFQAAFQGIM